MRLKRENANINRAKSFAAVLILLLSPLVASAEPLGEIDTVGTTWLENQWRVVNVDEMIALHPLTNNICLTWTYASPYPYFMHRRGYYNYYDPQTGWACGDTGCWMFPGVSNQEYHSIMLKSGDGGLGNFEFGLESFDPYVRTMRAWYEADSFNSIQLDTIAYPDEFEVRRAMGFNGRVHLVGSSFQDLSWVGLFYSSYNMEPFSIGQWQMVDTLSPPNYNIASSNVTGKTAIFWFRHKIFNHEYYSYQFDTDVRLITSPDGINWDWNAKQNITNFALTDPLRPVSDGDILISQDENIHIFFTTREIMFDSTNRDSVAFDKFMSYIWHWSEESDSFTVVADGWIHDPDRYACISGYRWPVCRVQAAEDPETGFLYAVYERRTYEDCSALPYLYPNADLYISVSTDNGINWSTGINITNSPSPNCIPPDCFNEMEASINELVNDTLHIVYILDKDGAYTWLEEAGNREGQVIYQKIPADLIPTTPLLQQFSIREGPIRCHYFPGDLNGDGERNGSDIIYAVNYLKGGNASPTVECDCPGIPTPFYGAGDVNGSCAFNGLDVTYYVAHLKGRYDRLHHCENCPPDECWPIDYEK